MEIKELQAKLRQFAKERDWDQFHSPKNLAMALNVEAGELLELFQWLTEEQSQAITNDPQDKKRVEEELADIFLYLVRMADRLNIDLTKVAQQKIALNAEKYPISKAKGNARKYNKY